MAPHSLPVLVCDALFPAPTYVHPAPESPRPLSSAASRGTEQPSRESREELSFCEAQLGGHAPPSSTPLSADNLDLSYCNSPLLSPAPTAAGSLSLSSLHPSRSRGSSELSLSHQPSLGMMGNARQARNQQRPAPDREEENAGFGLFQGPLGASWGQGSILLLPMKPRLG